MEQPRGESLYRDSTNSILFRCSSNEPAMFKNFYAFCEWFQNCLPKCHNLFGPKVSVRSPKVFSNLWFEGNQKKHFGFYMITKGRNKATRAFPPPKCHFGDGMKITEINIYGNDRIRTDDFMRAKHAFYQLNYVPANLARS